MIHKELNHVNVVQMHHYFEDNFNVYMLLEACPRKVSCVSYSPHQFIVPYRAFARKISQLYLSTFTTGIRSDENSTGDARPRRPVNYLSRRQISTIGAAIKRRCPLILSLVLYSRVLNIFVCHFPLVKSFSKFQSISIAVQHLRDLNRRVEVILHAVPEKQLWIHRACLRAARDQQRPRIFISPERERHLHSSWLICRPVCTVRMRRSIH